MNGQRDSVRMVVSLAIAAVFAALVWVATLALTVSVPATTGYFNVGETVIYVGALLFGAYVGAFAGGVGAAFADMLVAAQFAPGTLAIKAFEGAIVGSLNKKLRGTSRSSWRILTAILGIVVGVLLAAVGSAYYTGEVQLFLGYPAPKNPTFTVFIPIGTWYFLGAIVALLVVFMGFRIDPGSGQALFSMMVGGLEMVAGYFLYERLVLGDLLAIVEVPVNIGQMVIGLVVALPIARIVLRSLPQLKS
jgi:uncharacterized membrane protein